MAYIKSLEQKCESCGKKATKEVIDRWNGSCGSFCTECAKTRLKQVLRYESNPRDKQA
jgi:hypothetical protein